MLRWAQLGWALVIGVVVGAVLSVTHTTAGTLAAAALGAVLLLVGVWAYPRYVLPGLIREGMRRHSFPLVPPPRDAEHAVCELPVQVVDALNARDWTALRSLLADGFRVAAREEASTRGPRAYVRSARMLTSGFPDLRIEIDEVLASAERPELLFVALSERGHSRRGLAMDAAWWEWWRVTPARDQIVELGLQGFVRFSAR